MLECNMVIGKVLTIDELMDEYGYEAVLSLPAPVCPALWASPARA